MQASGLAVEAHGDDVLRRFARPIRRPAFWASLWAAAVAVELAALSSIVFADDPVPGYRALFSPQRRRLRGLRADRMAPAPPTATPAHHSFTDFVWLVPQLGADPVEAYSRG